MPSNLCGPCDVAGAIEGPYAVCINCRGDVEKYVRSAIHQGAIDALRDFGRHHPTKCARLADHTATCDCGWQEQIDRFGLERKAAVGA